MIKRDPKKYQASKSLFLRKCLVFLYFFAFVAQALYIPLTPVVVAAGSPVINISVGDHLGPRSFGYSSIQGTVTGSNTIINVFYDIRRQQDGLCLTGQNWSPSGCSGTRASGGYQGETYVWNQAIPFVNQYAFQNDSKYFIDVYAWDTDVQFLKTAVTTKSFTWDASSPTSTLADLDSFYRNDIIEIKLESLDYTVSPPKSTDLYYRRNSGAWTKYAGSFDGNGAIQFNTSSTGGDGFYEFYTKSTDYVGNVEGEDWGVHTAWQPVALPIVVEASTIVDNHGPTISLNPGPATVEKGATYTDPGATALDSLDGDIAVMVDLDAVDTSSVGSFDVVYKATDSGANMTTITRTITVIDTTAPVITLNGAPAITLTQDDVYTELGATTDDGSAVTASVLVNTGIPGNYVVNYNSVDASGNTAVEVYRTIRVIDTIAPVITLNGVSVMSLTQGDTYVELGATTDDGSAVTRSGLVNTGVPGTYEISYDSVDASGNVAIQLSRTVTVKALPVVVNPSTVTPTTTTTAAQPVSTVSTATPVSPGVDSPLAAPVVPGAANVSQPEEEVKGATDASKNEVKASTTETTETAKMTKSLWSWLIIILLLVVGFTTWQLLRKKK